MSLNNPEFHPANSRYRPDIDGLRALAVVPVVLFHAGLGFTGGFVGVDIFFVISGYLITKLVYADVDRGKFSLFEFWERRIRRILPALLVVVLATFVAGWLFLLPDDFEMLARSAIAQVSLVSNIFFRKQSGYFAPGADTKPLLHTWSLSVEEQFYVVFPLLLFFAAKRYKSSIPKIIMVLWCVSFAFSIYSTHHHAAKAFFHLQNRAWELLTGSLLAVMATQPIQKKWVFESASCVGIGAIIFSIAFYNSETRSPGLAALLPCLGAFLLIWSNGPRLTSIGKLLAWKPFVFIGLISYSLYLWHWPLIVFAKYWNWNQWNWDQIGVGQKLIFVAGTVALATASWRWIETPFRRRVVFASRRRIFTLAVASCALTLALAGWVRWQNGIPSRFPPRVLEYAAMKDDRSFLNKISLSQALKGNFTEIGTTNTNQAITFLLWGDSHAMAAAPALAKICQEQNLRAVQASHSSTAPLCDYKQQRGLGEESVEFGGAVVKFVKEKHVSNVVLAARWNGYPRDEQFKNSLLRTIARLHESGAQVWILKEVPNHHWDVPRAAAKEVLAGRNPELLGLPLDQHLAARTEINQLFDVARNAGANLLDPTEFLTTNQVCLAVADGKCLYVDSHHLTTHGAMRIKPLFRRIVAAKP